MTHRSGSRRRIPAQPSLHTTHGAWSRRSTSSRMETRRARLALTLPGSQQAHLTVLYYRARLHGQRRVHTIVNASLRARKNGRRWSSCARPPDIYACSR